MLYNVYCDETCHLEHDNSNVMVLGAVWCPQSKLKEINERIRQIKKRNNVSEAMEMKWTKISPAKVDLYKDLVNYFFDDDDLHFRGVIIPDKTRLNHERYHQTHDAWYYKMYFLMLDPIINPLNEYQILVDIKDTRGGSRIIKLHEVLCNNKYDFKQEVIKNIVQINSKESEILQLADLINGALGFYHRQLDKKLDANEGKILLAQELQKKCSLDKSTVRSEQKFNLFIWKPRI